jgi:hypothetical protein
MIYVAVIPVAVGFLIESPRYVKVAQEHWQVCSRLAEGHRRKAGECRLIGDRYPGSTVIAPDVGFHTKTGKFVPATGQMVARMVPYHESLADFYSGARWQPWADLPDEPPVPSPIDP